MTINSTWIELNNPNNRTLSFNSMFLDIGKHLGIVFTLTSLCCDQDAIQGISCQSRDINKPTVGNGIISRGNHKIYQCFWPMVISRWCFGDDFAIKHQGYMVRLPLVQGGHCLMFLRCKIICLFSTNAWVLLHAGMDCFVCLGEWMELNIVKSSANVPTFDLTMEWKSLVKQLKMVGPNLAEMFKGWLLKHYQRQPSFVQCMIG